MLLWLVLPQLWRQKYIAFSLTECLPAVSVGISCRLQAMQEQGKPTSVFCRPDPAAIHLWVTFKNFACMTKNLSCQSMKKCVCVGVGTVGFSLYSAEKWDTMVLFFFFFLQLGWLYLLLYEMTEALQSQVYYHQNWELLNLRVQCNHQCNSLFCTVNIKASNPALQKAPEYITTSFCTLGPAQTTAY